MANVLAFVEQRDGKIGGGGREVVSAAAGLAAALGGSAHALVLGGSGIASGAGELGQVGAEVVAVGEHDALGEYNPEGYVDVVVQRIRGGQFGAVLFSGSAVGRDLAPRVAALLDVPLVADATGLDGTGGTVFVDKPVYGGKAFARLEVAEAPALVSIRPNAFGVTERPAAGAVDAFAPAVDPEAWRVRVVERESTAEGALDVSEAKIVVSGGRGLKEAGSWALLEELQEALGAGVALGASRAVVDAGWRPHAEQVGQTGKTVAPELYIAVGISGAIQHLAGMRTSKTIVAINRDSDAPIFGVADYGIVGDLFEVVPRLTEEVKRLKEG